ncbi:unnamed protein product [Brassica rapa subsp. trilocularis]
MPKTARGPKTDEDLKSTNESKNTDTEQQQPNIPEKLQDLPKHKLKNTTASTKHPQYWNVSLNRLHHQGRGSSTDHKKPPIALTITPFPRTRDSSIGCLNTNGREEGKRSRGASQHHDEHAIGERPKTAVQIQNGEPIDLLYAPLFLQGA